MVELSIKRIDGGPTEEEVFRCLEKHVTEWFASPHLARLLARQLKVEVSPVRVEEVLTRMAGRGALETKKVKGKVYYRVRKTPTNNAGDRERHTTL